MATEPLGQGVVVSVICVTLFSCCFEIRFDAFIMPILCSRCSRTGKCKHTALDEDRLKFGMKVQYLVVLGFTQRYG